MLQRLKWLAEAPQGAEPPEWLIESGSWAEGIARSLLPRWRPSKPRSAASICAGRPSRLGRPPGPGFQLTWPEPSQPWRQC